MQKPDRTSPRVMFRCSADLLDWLNDQSEQDDRNLSDWIRAHFEAFRKKRQPTVDKVRKRA